MTSPVFQFPSLQQEASNVAKNVVSQTLDGKKYAHGKVGEWIEQINEACIKQLKILSPNFKFIVSSILVQKKGAGLNVESLSHWDPTTDGSVTVKYENETLICICTVIGIAI